MRPDDRSRPSHRHRAGYPFGSWSRTVLVWPSSRLVRRGGAPHDQRERIGRGARDRHRGAAPDWSPDGTELVFEAGSGIYWSGRTGRAHATLARRLGRRGRLTIAVAFSRRCRESGCVHDGSDGADSAAHERSADDVSPGCLPTGADRVRLRTEPQRRSVRRRCERLWRKAADEDPAPTRLYWAPDGRRIAYV